MERVVQRNFAIAAFVISLFAAVPSASFIVLILVNSVNPLQVIFISSFNVRNESGEALKVWVAGRHESGRIDLLPLFAASFPAVPTVRTGDHVQAVLRKTPVVSAARRWAFAALILTAGTLLAGTVAALLLDTFVRRPPGAGSITTLLPGFTYASATVMKVSVVAGLVAAVAAVTTHAFGGAQRGTAGRLLTAGLASVALVPVALLAGTVAILLAQTSAASVADFTYVSRIAVFVQLGVTAAAALAATVSLRRRDPPTLLAVLALTVNVLLIALCWHFEFYAVGFDQDTWAPR